MTDWPKLIADLEAWDGTPSRDLADRVLVAWGWSYDPWENGFWYAPNSNAPVSEDDLPDPLRSMDAAIAGVPDGMLWGRQRYSRHFGGMWVCLPHENSDLDKWWFGARNHPPPADLTTAICNARQEME